MGASLLVVLAASGCTSHHSNASPSSGPAVVAPSPAAALATVAQLARDANYTATYRADSSDSPPRSNTIIVFRTSTQTRLDVTGAAGHVLIQVDPTGTYTCNLPTSGTPSCLTLAGPGQAVPPSLDPEGQALFTTTLDVLAQDNDLTVASEAPIAATNGLPAANCYAVIAAPAGGVSPGTYCFTGSGILTRVQFRSSILQLTKLAAAPVDSDFTLPATPLPLGTPASSGAPPSPATSS
ncbi:MAG TPA: hypothetical protein VK662_11020 [Acidothermaceae bacterium]|nr:hypothetical protein [Acidothermaceae bacterium]